MVFHRKRAEPGSLDLAGAERAFKDAEKLRWDAHAAVDTAMRRFPPDLQDRRMIATLQPLSGFEDQTLSQQGLTKEARSLIEARVSFYDALKAEEMAIAGMSRARDALDEVQHAAEILALGDGRANLAQAIRNADAAVAALAEHDAAIEAAHQAVIDTYRAQDEAEAAVKQATEDAAWYAVAKLRGDAGDPPKTPKEARAELQDLMDSREAVRAVHKTLKEQRPPFQSGVSWAPQKVDKAIAHVVRADPVVTAVVDDFARVNGEWLRLKGILDTLRRGGMLPEGVNPDRMPEIPTDKPGAAAWTIAITALRTDPAAKLPLGK